MESYRSLGKLRGQLRRFDAAGTGDERWQARSDLLKEAKILLSTVTEMSGGASAALLAEVEELTRRSEPPRRTTGASWRAGAAPPGTAWPGSRHACAGCATAPRRN
jgi:hypothetical protein